MKINSRLTLSIIGLLFLWAGLLALGAYAGSENRDWRKPLLVFATIGGFATIWLVALLIRSRSSKSQDLNV